MEDKRKGGCLLNNEKRLSLTTMPKRAFLERELSY